MKQLTETYVDSLALNASAIKNGRDLVKKNSFIKLCQSEDETLLFGECKGSGSKPYSCSVDFIKEESPVFRCSCPSRQFPCKHLLGLMYAYTGGKAFEAQPIPQDILDKREKAEKREEKKKEATNPASDQPAKRKTNTAALAKKITAQLEGVTILEKLLLQLVQSGLGSLDNKLLQILDAQAKELGNHYVPGLQTALRELVLILRSEGSREEMYTQAAEYIPILYMLVKKSRDYLQKKAEAPRAKLDTESNLEEWIGHAWQLAELRECGRVQENRELLQLSFRSYSDHARGEYIDEGCWVDLENGKLHLTRTYRPFRAAKYIKEEDSCYEVMQVKVLFLYPGELNGRVRWEEASARPMTGSDLEAVRSQGGPSIQEAVKAVKNQIKNPLSDKHPLQLLAYSELKQDREGMPVLLDAQGKSLQLADLSEIGQPTTHLLSMLHKDHLKNQVMLVRFGHEPQTNRLLAQPLTIITQDTTIRLLY